MVRKQFLLALLSGYLLFAPWAHGQDDLEALGLQNGAIEIAVYNNFVPFSSKQRGKVQGIDVDIGRALAKQLGVMANFRVIEADESMSDDLRNNVWKGHYLGGGVADVMVHVPVDKRFAEENDQVIIFAPYYKEQLVVASNAKQIGNSLTLEVFTKKKIGVEIDTISDIYLLSAFGGNLRENVVHYRNLTEAAQALAQGEIAAIMGPKGEVEGVLGATAERYRIQQMPTPGLTNTHWSIGLATKQNRKALAKTLQRIIRKLIDSGQMAQIFKQHHVGYQPPAPGAVTMATRLFAE